MAKNEIHAERAKIFMPFDALKGFKEALKEKEKVIVDKIELSEEEKDKLIYKLDSLKKGMMIKVVYYSEGQYIELKGILSRINVESKSIVIVKEKISVENILSLEFLDEDFKFMNEY
ncbi:MAG: YolD-like family protein [Bacilli bacterium]|nr:YolD-like family protein [Bacilli bacterium]